jgi:GNAT superfamily N-acetyltransferase
MVGQARFTPESAHRRVGEILAAHLRHKVACDWVVGPVSQPANLSQALKAHGFSCRIHCAGMACDLNARREKPGLPPGAEIQESNVPARIYPLTTERRRALHQGLTLVGEFKPRTVWHFSAHVDGKAVGRSMLQTGAGVAGIYGVGVMENHQRKGIGTALVHAALERARALGFRAAVLGATGMGQGVYERLGFREVCKLSFWKYGKMRQLD